MLITCDYIESQLTVDQLLGFSILLQKNYSILTFSPPHSLLARRFLLLEKMVIFDKKILWLQFLFWLFIWSLGVGDTGDHWRVVCDGDFWERDDSVMFKHLDTNAFLATSGNIDLIVIFKIINTIIGQL